ncbi:BatD family protein [Beggiatoa alba]|nr:BatD family protein [Beggiatoa alba]
MRKKIMFKKALGLWVILFLYSAYGFANESVTVEISRHNVQMNESFQITFTAVGAVGTPDFKPLSQDFEILSQAQSNQVSIINRQYTSQMVWRLELMPKHTGTLTVPAINFGNTSSTAAQIAVTAEVPASSTTTEKAKDLFLEVDAEPKNPYVQSQVIYTLRLFHAVDIANASLTDLNLAQGDAIVQRLGEDINYKTQRDNKAYRVIERKYAIFPQKSGALHIDPLILQAQLLDNNRYPRSAFDSFFTQQTGTTKKILSNPIDLTVQPIPSEFSGTQWLPAKQIVLQEEWSTNPPQFEVGKPITRTITLNANGLTAGQLPILVSNNYYPADLKSYPDQTQPTEQMTSSGAISARQEKTAIIPTKAGQYVLPAISVSWWNTNTNTMEVATLPEQTIKVAPSATAPEPQPVQTTAPVTASTPPVVNNATTPAPVVAAPAPAMTVEHSMFWQWVSAGLAVGWLLTIMAWIWVHYQARQIKQLVKNNRQNPLQHLQQACMANDAIQAKSALLEWAKMQWASRPPVSLGDIGVRCGEPVLQEIQTLNRLLYSQQTQDWQGNTLWSAIQAYLATQVQQRKSKANVEPLEPLFKL